MGNDWKIYQHGEEISLYSMCPGNFLDIREKYGFDINVLHGHSGTVVIDYLTIIMNRMIADGVKILTIDEYKKNCKMNPNFNWGVTNDSKCENLPDNVRKSIVLYQVQTYYEYAETYNNGYWVGDETYYVGPYTITYKYYDKTSNNKHSKVTYTKIYEGIDISFDDESNNYY